MLESQQANAFCLPGGKVFVYTGILPYCRTEAGLAAMRAVVRAYHAGGGIAIHFNVMDADTLVDAQQHPEKYRGLQVRVCGWNVHFTEMCRREQDAFIRRARSLAT